MSTPSTTSSYKDDSKIYASMKTAFNDVDITNYTTPDEYLNTIGSGTRNAPP